MKVHKRVAFREHRELLKTEVVDGIRVEKIKKAFYKDGFSMWYGYVYKVVWETPDCWNGYFTTRWEAVESAKKVLKHKALLESNK